jgi:hypothetical protein
MALQSPALPRPGRSIEPSVHTRARAGASTSDWTLRIIVASNEILDGRCAFVEKRHRCVIEL